MIPEINFFAVFHEEKRITLIDPQIATMHQIKIKNTYKNIVSLVFSTLKHTDPM